MSQKIGVNNIFAAESSHFIPQVQNQVIAENLNPPENANQFPAENIIPDVDQNPFLKGEQKNPPQNKNCENPLVNQIPLPQDNLVHVLANPPQNSKQSTIASLYSHFTTQLKKHFCDKSFGFFCSMIVLIVGIVYSNAYGFQTNKIDNWPQNHYISINEPDHIVYNRFMLDNTNLDTIMDIPPLNDTEEFLKKNRFLKEARLNIIIGESGIGKSTAFKYYAKKLRNKGIPVMYASLEKDQPFNFDSFVETVFGTKDRTNYSRVIQQFPNESTLIIDNIQLAKYTSNGKPNEKLFTFINGYLMQTLRMHIIMLTSQNRFAYEIQPISGYETRLHINEFQGRDESFLQNYASSIFSESLRNSSLRLSKENASTFVCYFGKDLNYFAAYKVENLILKEEKQKVIRIKIKSLEKLNKINTTSILQNIYEKMSITDGWTTLDDISSDYYEALNDLEDLNLVVSKDYRTLYKIKNNLIISVCCKPWICSTKR